MKKIFLVLASVLLAAAIVNGQRVDIDRGAFAKRERHLPSIVLDPSYQTFSVGITSSVSVEKYVNQSFADQIRINGMKQVPSGHVKIEIYFDNLMIEGTEIKQRTETAKNASGVEYSKTIYTAVISYSFSATARAVDYKNNAVLNSYIMAYRPTGTSRAGIKTFTSPDQSSYGDASSYFDNNRNELKSQFINKEINLAIQDLNRMLGNDFGFTPVFNNGHVWYVDSKKHPEYAQSQEVFKTVKSVFDGVSAEDSLKSSVKESLKEAIAYYEGLPAKYSNMEEKADKKLRFMAYYSLGIIYYMLEDPKKAMTYGQKVIDNDYDKGDGKDLITWSENLISLLKKQKRTSCHFPIDLSKAEGPK